MDVRVSTDPASFAKLGTQELRMSFLIDTLFTLDSVPMVYSDVDRSITGSAVPVARSLTLVGSTKQTGTDRFAEHREVGVVNIGGDGAIRVDGTEFTLFHKDALYIGRGAKEIEFASVRAETPAKFYFVSYPAHKEFPTILIRFADAEHVVLGSRKEANRRTINKYILPGRVESSQLVMGLTELEEGSVWNTMPAHTHLRRSEVYLYFNLDSSAAVVHLVGKPDETRHLVVRNEQAVINPSWSIHAGAGTQNYSFVWAMGGENKAFDDMDGVRVEEML